MLDGDTVIQAERDIYIVREKRPRRNDDRRLLFLLVFLNFTAWMLVLYLSTEFKDWARGIVLSEVPDQVRLILLP
jgi:hypothetical protein